jgi:hypothetical protein
VITRAFAVLALVGFAIGLGAEIAGNVALARAGEAAFFMLGLAAWVMSMRKRWRRRVEASKLAPRGPLTTELAQAAAQSIARGRKKKR